MFKTRNLTRAAPRPEAEAIPGKPQPWLRIILLSGEWRMPRSVFHLEATIFAPPDGGAEGEILWTNVDTPAAPPDMACTELVRGAASAMMLDLKGYQVEAPLISEHYRIAFYGASTAGVFVGKAAAYGAWDARLNGTYRIVEQRP